MRHELNLLPLERRNVLAKQSLVDGTIRAVKNICYGLGVVSVGVALIVATLQIAAYVTSRTSPSTLTAEVASYQKLRGTISKQNQLYETLDAIDSNRISWTEKIKELFAVLPPGLNVGKMTAGTHPSVTLLFSGQAVNRNTLIVLEERIRALAWAQAVDAPHANLIDRLNPSYVFTIHIGDKKESKNDD